MDDTPMTITFEAVDDLPDGHRYKCEGPDWIVMKTEDDGVTWKAIGKLNPKLN